MRPPDKIDHDSITEAQRELRRAMALLDDLIVTQTRALNLVESAIEGPVKDLFNLASNPPLHPLIRTARHIA